MSAASWLIEKIFLLSGAGKRLTPEHFYKKLRKNAIRFKKGEKLRSPFLGVKVESDVYCGMRYYVFLPKEVDTARSVMYLHGSGYMCAHRTVQERFAAQLAKNTHAKVYFPIYPKLPMDTVTPCLAVLNNFYSFLARKGEIFLIGDSSGASLSLVLAAERKDIRRVIAISPWLILSLCVEARKAEKDVVLSLDMLERVARLWAYDLPFEHPKLSPYYGDYSGKEIMLFAGEWERFCPEIKRFVSEKRGECLSLTCEVGREQQHCYPLMPTPEGREARAVIYRKLHEWLYGGEGI